MICLTWGLSDEYLGSPSVLNALNFLTKWDMERFRYVGVTAVLLISLGVKSFPPAYERIATCCRVPREVGYQGMRGVLAHVSQVMDLLRVIRRVRWLSWRLRGVGVHGSKAHIRLS